MTDFGDNLLVEPLIDASPCGALSLPGLFAALARDEVEHFPALRPHQVPAWHMFLVQLAALAILRSGLTEMPLGEDEWRGLLRALTCDFPDDAAWRLVVEDWSKPAFLQPPVPKGVKLENHVPSPDALDLLITSKNHDLKQAVARRAAPQDWIFALVSLQTGEGYGGRDTYGIARMNGGFSSRSMLALAPLPTQGGKAMTPRPGAWLRRDVRALLEARDRELEANEHRGFPAEGGIGLVWLEPWSEVEQLRLPQLDIWFIEICRRVRLVGKGKKLSAVKGTSKATRIDAKTFKGALGDPFSPVHKTENMSLTLGEGDFDYRKLTDLLLSGDWSLPLLAKPASFDRQDETLALFCAALSRGQNKTDGFKSRILPLGGRKATLLGGRREDLHKLAEMQIGEIDKFDKALAYALALAAAGGDREKVKKEHYSHASEARARFDRAADEIFFERLWARFDAQDAGSDAFHAEKRIFARALFDKAKAVFEAALPAMPCAGIFRPRAEARARSAFEGKVRAAFPSLFQKSVAEDEQDAA